jgi:hypothetical protein
MRSPRARIAVLAVALACAACRSAQPPPLYRWSGYEQAVYEHQRAPQEREAWVASLWRVIEICRQKRTRAPPGVYAEYGYALYEEGRTADAIPWFELEAKEWPESRVFMQKMVRNAQQRGAPPAGSATTVPASTGPATTGPAGAIGGKP